MANIRNLGQRLRGARDPQLTVVAEGFEHTQSQFDKNAQTFADLQAQITALANIPPVVTTIPTDGDTDAVINVDGTVDLDMIQGVNWNLLLTRDVVPHAPIRSDSSSILAGDRLSIKVKQDVNGFWKVNWNAIFLMGGLDIDPNPNVSTVLNFTYTNLAKWQLRTYLSGLL